MWIGDAIMVAPSEIILSHIAIPSPDTITKSVPLRLSQLILVIAISPTIVEAIHIHGYVVIVLETQCSSNTSMHSHLRVLLVESMYGKENFRLLSRNFRTYHPYDPYHPYLRCNMNPVACGLVSL